MLLDFRTQQKRQAFQYVQLVLTVLHIRNANVVLIHFLLYFVNEGTCSLHSLILSRVLHHFMAKLNCQDFPVSRSLDGTSFMLLNVLSAVPFADSALYL